MDISILYPSLICIDFLSVSNLNFAGYTGSKSQVQNSQKIKFIQLDFFKLDFSKIKCRSIEGIRAYTFELCFWEKKSIRWSFTVYMYTYVSNGTTDGYLFFVTNPRLGPNFKCLLLVFKRLSVYFIEIFEICTKDGVW